MPGDGDYAGLPAAKPRESAAWFCHPPDEAAYEAFVRHVLRRASVADPAEVPTLPFTVGLQDGIDARATLRRWHERRIFVRQESGTRVQVTNGIIDWEHATEFDPRLQAPTWGGWIDPSFRHVGSASRDRPATKLHDDPFVQLVERTFSLLTLDQPTWQKP